MSRLASATDFEEQIAVTSRTHPAAETHAAYSPGRILGIWALATIPMGLLGWVVFPALSPDVRVDPLGAGVLRMLLLTLGLIWQFVLSLLIVRQEAGDLRWATVKRRLRLDAPRDPATGAPRRGLWLWAIPFVIAIGLWELTLGPAANRLWVGVFPMLAEPPDYSLGSAFSSPEILAQFAGAWWFFGLFLLSAIFTILGEEFLFRGILLPRMDGVFGRWSWVANGVLFGLYHVHQPWGMPSNVVAGVLFLAFPSWRFRTTWMAAIVHSLQSVYFGVLVLGIVLGLA